MKTSHPIEIRSEDQPGGGSKRHSERGVALLMVLAALAVMIPFTATFNYDAKVDWQGSVNTADKVKARNMQRGALGLSVLMFELQRMVFNQKQFREFVGGQLDITQVAPYLMSIFGSKDGAQALGDFVGVDATALGDLSLDGGGFEVRVEAESGRVNLNCLNKADSKGSKVQSQTATMLAQLMAPRLYDPLFEEDKSDGQNYRRTDVLSAIVDYVDDNRRSFDPVRMETGGGAERYRYTELYDPYQPRNARLDSLEELQLVEGIDDDWMAAFGDELTVYGSCKININFASARQIAAVLVHAVSARDSWKTDPQNYLGMILPLANFVVEARQFNLFEKLTDLKSMVGKPDQYMMPAFLSGGDDAEQQTNPFIPDGLEVRVNEGCRNDSCWGGLREIATVEPERYYRIEITTDVGAARTRVDAVYDMQYGRSNSSGKGAWLFFREE